MRVQSPRSFRRRRQLRVLLVTLGVIILGLLLPGLISTVSYFALKPVHAVHIWLNESSSLVPTFIRDRVYLNNEIEDLKQQLAIANKTNLTQQRLWEENNRLRSLLGVNEDSRQAAAVIARPNELPYDLLQIDKGEDDGIAVGAPVFMGRDVVIGLVVFTASDYSFVELVSSSGFVSTAFVSGPNVTVPLEGLGGGVARVKLPQGLSLRDNDLVYLPTIDPGVYGRVSYVEDDPTQPQQFGYITPNIPINSLFYVSVGQRSQVTQDPKVIDENIKKMIQKELISGQVELVSSSTATTSDEIKDI